MKNIGIITFSLLFLYVFAFGVWRSERAQLGGWKLMASRPWGGVVIDDECVAHRRSDVPMPAWEYYFFYPCLVVEMCAKGRNPGKLRLLDISTI
ncbi:MAG: hypothetical protein AAB263_19590 [Planctomycetota bacterium]